MNMNAGLSEQDAMAAALTMSVGASKGGQAQDWESVAAMSRDRRSWGIGGPLGMDGGTTEEEVRKTMLHNPFANGGCGLCFSFDICAP